MHADCNAGQKAAHEAAGMGITNDSDLFERDRHIAALETMVGYAVSNLSSKISPIPEQEKRQRLVLLFGGSHIDGIKELIAEGNLPIAAHSTEDTQRIAVLSLVAKHLSGSLQGILKHLK